MANARPLHDFGWLIFPLRELRRRQAIDSFDLHHLCSVINSNGRLVKRNTMGEQKCTTLKAIQVGDYSGK